MNSARSAMSDAANIIAATAAVIGFIALIVGVATLLSSARTARLQQMHDLFKEYLKLEFDYYALVGDNNMNCQKVRGSLGGFKMYSLEEMTLWLRRERNWRIIYLLSAFHRRHIESWQATIEWHLDHSSDIDYTDYREAISCYGPDFRKVVRASLTRTGRLALLDTPPPDLAAVPPGI